MHENLKGTIICIPTLPYMVDVRLVSFLYFFGYSSTHTRACTHIYMTNTQALTYILYLSHTHVSILDQAMGEIREYLWRENLNYFSR